MATVWASQSFSTTNSIAQYESGVNLLISNFTSSTTYDIQIDPTATLTTAGLVQDPDVLIIDMDDYTSYSHGYGQAYGGSTTSVIKKITAIDKDGIALLSFRFDNITTLTAPTIMSVNGVTSQSNAIIIDPIKATAIAVDVLDTWDYKIALAKDRLYNDLINVLISLGYNEDGSPLDHIDNPSILNPLSDVLTLSMIFRLLVDSGLYETFKTKANTYYNQYKTDLITTARRLKIDNVKLAGWSSGRLEV